MNSPERRANMSSWRSAGRAQPAPRGFSLVVVCLLLIVFMVDCGRNEPRGSKTEMSVPVSVPSEFNWIECKGLVRPTRLFTRYLNQGEQIHEYFIREGARIKKGERLVRLSNALFTEEYASLSGKKLEMKEKEDAVLILDMEITKAEKDIVQLDEQIEETKKIGQTMASYPVEAEIKRLTRGKESLEESLKILRLKRDAASKRTEDLKKMLLDLEGRMSEIRIQLDHLTIGAPFDGIVAFVPDIPESVKIGEPLLELWDDQEKTIEAFVWQHQLSVLKPGNEALIYTDFQKDAEGRGVVKQIKPKPLQEEIETYPKYKVTIDIVEGGAKLRIDASVSLRIKVSPLNKQ